MQSLYNPELLLGLRDVIDTILLRSDKHLCYSQVFRHAIRYACCMCCDKMQKNYKKNLFCYPYHVIQVVPEYWWHFVQIDVAPCAGGPSHPRVGLLHWDLRMGSRSRSDRLSNFAVHLNGHLWQSVSTSQTDSHSQSINRRRIWTVSDQWRVGWHTRSTT